MALAISFPSVFIFIPDSALHEKKESGTEVGTFSAFCLLSVKGMVSLVYPGGVREEQVRSARGLEASGAGGEDGALSYSRRPSCRPLSASVCSTEDRARSAIRSLPAAAAVSKTKLV